jgi:hypothetical protein
MTTQQAGGQCYDEERSSDIAMKMGYLQAEIFPPDMNAFRSLIGVRWRLA